MYQWQLAKEKGHDHTVIVESDGMWYLTAPPNSWQDFADRLPADYDVLVLEHDGKAVQVGPMKPVLKALGT
jgi:hypothetical protein